MQLITSAEMQRVSATKPAAYVPGRKYVAFDATLGEVEAVFIKTADAITVIGAAMFPVTANWNVAGNFEADEDETDAGVIGQELSVGSWLGGTQSAVCYGFVQTKGPNLVTITTDNTVDANDIVLPGSTPGEWIGLSRDTLVTDPGNTPWARLGFAPAADGATTMVAGKVFWHVRLAQA